MCCWSGLRQQQQQRQQQTTWRVFHPSSSPPSENRSEEEELAPRWNFHRTRRRGRGMVESYGGAVEKRKSKVVQQLWKNAVKFFKRGKKQKCVLFFVKMKENSQLFLWSPSYKVVDIDRDCFSPLWNAATTTCLLPSSFSSSVFAHPADRSPPSTLSPTRRRRRRNKPPPPPPPNNRMKAAASMEFTYF